MNMGFCAHIMLILGSRQSVYPTVWKSMKVLPCSKGLSLGQQQSSHGSVELVGIEWKAVNATLLVASSSKK